MLENIIGATASIVGCILFIPQAYAVWVNRDNSEALKGASIQTNILLLLNSVLWFTYSWITSAFWVGAPGYVNIPLTIMCIIIIARSRTKKVVIS